MNAPEVAAQAHTNEMIPTVAPTIDKTPAMPREGTGRKLLKYGGGIGIVTLVAALGVYKVMKSGDHNVHREEAVASARDPHADQKNTPLHDATKRLQLDHYRTKAEEALSQIDHFEHHGHTDKLRGCLAALERWRDEHRKMHGEPTPPEVNGLVVTSRSTEEETKNEDLWKYVTDAIDRLYLILGEPAVSGTDTAPIHK